MPPSILRAITSGCNAGQPPHHTLVDARTVVLKISADLGDEGVEALHSPREPPPFSTGPGPFHFAEFGDRTQAFAARGCLEIKHAC